MPKKYTLQMVAGKYRRREDGEAVTYEPGDEVPGVSERTKQWLVDDLGHAVLAGQAADAVEEDEGEEQPQEGEGEEDEGSGGGASPGWPDGLPPNAVAGLESQGYTPAKVSGATDDQLLGVGGVGPASLEKLRQALGGPPGEEE